MTSALLRRALADPGVRALPDRAVTLLEKLKAPPRLTAHLRLVHEVACHLTEWMTANHPAVKFDCTAVLFGAATHDIGKTIHLAELSGPGSLHEQAGYELLLAHDVDDNLARFARSHASWGAAVGVEDLLVSLADKIWKAKRVPDLEQLVVDRLAAASGRQSWETFMALDDELDRIAADADRRLAFQASYPITA